MEKQLYMISEKDIQELIPSINDVVNELSIKTHTPSNLLESLPSSHTSCHLIEKFKGIIFSRADVKNLSEIEQNEIKINIVLYQFL